MLPVSLRGGRIAALALAPIALCMALAGCGGASVASAANASATPTCPATTPTATLKFVTGKIKAATRATLTVAPASGAAVTVQLTSTTRLTKLAPTTLSAIKVGDVAQVMTAANGVVATSITVSGFGGFRNGAQGGNSQPRATRTPGARFNPTCFRRAGQPGGAFGANGAQGGRVTDVSTSQITVTDAQGEALSYGVTASTVILAPTPATAANLVAGASVTVTGTASGSAIVARSVTITSAG